MTPTVFAEPDALLRAAPLDLGGTAWVEIGAGEVSSFEAGTGGAVSGYYALSLTNRFLPELLQVPGASSGINYGAETVRFGAPLRAGDRVRGAARLVAASEVGGGVQTAIEITVEVAGTDRPACVVRSLSRWLR
ncbi:MAG TPA: dehydratase [Acidimicrobiales bacterium]|nr:dehydratase [Acidimicrobiales bacterium]